MFTMGASHTFEATHVEFFSDEDQPEVDLGSITNSNIVQTTPNTRILKDHLVENVIGDVKSSVQTRRMTNLLLNKEPTSIAKALSNSSWVEVMQEELLQFKLQQVWILVDLPIGKRVIGTKWVFKNKKDERGIVLGIKQGDLTRDSLFKQKMGEPEKESPFFLARISLCNPLLLPLKQLGASKDYNPEQNEDNAFTRMLEHKEAIISHLSWASLFLGFHTLGLYVHNDVMLAFGTPEKQILIEPIFAQWIQSAHGKTSYGFDILLSSTNGPAFNAGRSIWLPGWLNAINENSNSLFLTIGPGDFLVHHAIALGLHTTTLILVKGALDARGSKLMPDKKDFGYSFPCDGPGRGGTCDISAWDAFYLAVFWMLNTIGWVTFYWHWKHITLWQGNVSQFNESSTYLMGWLRDYLWLNSSQLINGYNPFGMNSLSVWAWMFLFGHLVWATGFMFLISWRGYWQELIETLAWAHERTPLANLIRWRDKPVALSIVQARLVGLAHFSVGYIFTYAAFLIASTSGKFG
ncbi:photosystem I P700 apoprotein A2 [Tanacetum coccineum]